MPTANAGNPVDVDGMTVNKNSPPRPRMTKSVLGQGQQQMTIYLAIFKDDKKTIVIEFTPLLDGPEFEPFFSGIEIESIDIQQLPHTWAEQRAAYQQTPTPKKPRQLEFFQ
jgi:hypothetical protein